MDANEKLKEINNSLNEGWTIYICTYLRQWKVSPQTAKKFRLAGKEVFKTFGNGLFMAQGKKYTCIDYCAIRRYK